MTEKWEILMRILVLLSKKKTKKKSLFEKIVELMIYVFQRNISVWNLLELLIFQRIDEICLFFQSFV
jgi:hypothetical protein